MREKWFSGQLLVMKLWKKRKKKAAYFFISLLCWEKKEKLARFASVWHCGDAVPVQWNGAPLLDCHVGSVPKEGLELCCNSHHPLHRSLHSSQVVLQLSLLFAPRLLYQTPFQASVLEHLLNAECQRSLSSLRPQLTGHVEVLNSSRDCLRWAGPECVYEKHDRHSKMREWAVIQGAAPPSGIIFPPTGKLKKSGGESVCLIRASVSGHCTHMNFETVLYNKNDVVSLARNFFSFMQGVRTIRSKQLILSCLGPFWWK